MKPCVYRGAITETHCECDNTKDMVHGGLVPLSVCGRCPFSREPDFFAQTQRLIVSQQSQGVYVPRPRTCGGCGTVKRRVDVLQFVWPYWHAGASGDEIRWSVRSVEQHYEGKALCTIVGDRPPWWRGHVIDCPRIAPTANRGFRDMLNKMHTIATHPEIQSEFVWMMDDVYLVKPVTLDELQQPRAYGWREDLSNSWQKRKSNTMRVLRESGHTNHDYATHLPHWAEKSKLADLFERFDLKSNTLLWEVLYGNVHRSRPIRPEPFFCRLLAPVGLPELRQRARLASVLNHVATGWNEPLRQYLSELLPTPATGEVEDSGFRPEFRRVGRPARRPVKRRHPSTWKCNQPQPIQ